jgi:uncharacterized protein YkwD
MKEKLLLFLLLISILIFYYEYKEGTITNFFSESIKEIPTIETTLKESEELKSTQSEFSELELEVQKLVNEERVNHGLKQLTWNDDLAVVARSHSEDMIKRNFFQHKNPDGLDYQDRLEKEDIYYFNKTGENLYSLITQVNQSIVVEKAVEGWMNSIGHREIILDEDFNEAGVGIVNLNRTEFYITHVFISRAECGYKGGPCCKKPGFLPNCYVPYKCISEICK